MPWQNVIFCFWCKYQGKIISDLLYIENSTLIPVYCNGAVKKGRREKTNCGVWFHRYFVERKYYFFVMASSRSRRLLLLMIWGPSKIGCCLHESVFFGLVMMCLCRPKTILVLHIGQGLPVGKSQKLKGRIFVCMTISRIGSPLEIRKIKMHAKFSCFTVFSAPRIWGKMSATFFTFVSQSLVSNPSMAITRDCEFQSPYSIPLNNFCL